MVGSAVLVLPYNFMHGGFLRSLIVMTLMGFASYYTCRIIIQVRIEGELDFSNIIFRILGKKWQVLYSFASIALLYLAGIVYFLLANQVLYSFVNFILDKFNYNNKVAINDIEFSKFSV